MARGDVFCVRNWDHVTKNATFKYGFGGKRRGITVVMMVLGEESVDGPPLDLEAAMNAMGWFRRVSKEEEERQNDILSER